MDLVRLQLMPYGLQKVWWLGKIERLLQNSQPKTHSHMQLSCDILQSQGEKNTYKRDNLQNSPTVYLLSSLEILERLQI